MPPFRCTYRIQLNADFTFSDVESIAGYLRKIGVSHAYLSPILEAAPGSTHGYDVADPTRISERLGGEEGFLAAADALRAEGIGILLDTVPNHLSIETPANGWWWDVLENGPNSAYYHFFDFGIPGDLEHFVPLRLAVLADRYGEMLRGGTIQLERTQDDLRVTYGASQFPLAPHTYAPLFSSVAQLINNRELAALADAFSAPDASTRELWRCFLAFAAHPGNATSFDRGLAALARDVGRMHEVLNLQHYRLAYWRTASQSWHYRRFYDINTLAGLRIEHRDVFTARHLVEFSLLRRGLIEGLRIDHIDGLLDPLAYLQLLRDDFPETPVWVEKILGSDESLPLNWPVAGTTGYDYLNVLNGIFINRESEPELTTLYQEFTGEQETYAYYLDEAKREVLRQLFGGELTSLTDLFAQICERHPDARDSSRVELTDTILEYIVALPVYRTYVDAGEQSLSSDDAKVIEQTIAAVRERREDIQPAILGFLESLLQQQIVGDLETEFVLRLQQLTGPAMAKGAEDTAFYRYNRLLSLNEVGGDPGKFGHSVDEFHRFNDRLAREWPMTLLATSTHDTKRGEDARQRIDALTAMPQAWRQFIEHVSANCDAADEDQKVSRNVQYHFLQAMVSAWPVEAPRAIEFMRKVVRESKRETSWGQPNAEYEQALERFIETVLADEEFVRTIEEFVARVDAIALPNSLAQTLLKLTSPGVPDIYQGCEGLSYSLVDPDNRRPVDYERLKSRIADAGPVAIGQALEAGDGDLAKLSLVQTVLGVRSKRESCFEPGAGYDPLFAEGPAADRLIGYARGGDVVALALRSDSRPSTSMDDTFVDLPQGQWRNVFSNASFSEHESLSKLFAGSPVALLEREVN